MVYWPPPLFTSRVLHCTATSIDIHCNCLTNFPISIETNKVICICFKQSEICLFCLALRGAKLFWDTVTKSLGLLRLPWCQRHLWLTTFSAVLFLVAADAPWLHHDMVVTDALLLCKGCIPFQGFTWMNLASSFLSNDENWKGHVTHPGRH